MLFKSSTDKSKEWQHRIKCLLNFQVKQCDYSRIGRKTPCCDFPGFSPKCTRRIPYVPCCIPPLPLRVELTLCSANTFPQQQNRGFLLSLAPSPKRSRRLELHPLKYPTFACFRLKYRVLLQASLCTSSLHSFSSLTSKITGNFPPLQYPTHFLFCRI